MSRTGQNQSSDPATQAIGAPPSLTTNHSPLTTHQPSLLHYRPWRGQFRSAAWSVWPIARVSLAMIFRRKLFWGLYALGLLIFFIFFFGQYLLAWAETQAEEQTIKVGPIPIEPSRLIHQLRDGLRFNGSGYTFRNFFW